jgi:hypothetical protein
MHETLLDPECHIRLFVNLMELIFEELLSLRRSNYRITFKFCCSLYEEETKPACARWMEPLETETNRGKEPTPNSDAD